MELPWVGIGESVLAGSQNSYFFREVLLSSFLYIDVLCNILLGKILPLLNKKKNWRFLINCGTNSSFEPDNWNIKFPSIASLS